METLNDTIELLLWAVVTLAMLVLNVTTGALTLPHVVSGKKKRKCFSTVKQYFSGNICELCKWLLIHRSPDIKFLDASFSRGDFCYLPIISFPRFSDKVSDKCVKLNENYVLITTYDSFGNLRGGWVFSRTNSLAGKKCIPYYFGSTFTLSSQNSPERRLNWFTSAK